VNIQSVDLSGDAATWGVYSVVLKVIKVVTSATDWTLTIYSHSDGSSGILPSLVIASNQNGNKEFMVDIPFKIHNSVTTAFYVKFVDNASTNGATLSVYGIKAR
jgi:hypothetical protein